MSQHNDFITPPRTLLASLTARACAAPILLGVATLLAACTSDDDDSFNPGQPTTATIRGQISVLLPDSTVLEAEPNDTVGQAHALGQIGAGDSLTVIGDIMETGADEIDGFTLVAPERVLIDVTLSTVSQSADLDLYIVDPVSLQAVETFATANASESGTFAAEGTFFLVVDSFMGDSDYELSIEARAISGSIAEAEPNDSADQGEYLGTFAPGDQFSVAGDAADSSSDFFLVAVPEATQLDLSCAFGAGDDFDLVVYDVTADLANPVQIARFDDSLANPEIGSVNVPAMQLLAIEVLPFAGTSAWQLDLNSSQGLVVAGGGPGALQVAPLSTAPRGSLDRQRALMRGAPPARMFAEAVHPAARGDLIVELASDEASAEDFAARHGGIVAATVPDGPRRVRFAVPAELSDEEAARYTLALAASLRGRPGVRIAEPNYLLQPFAVQGETRPNDEFYNLQWHYEQIKLPQAWEITRGSNAVRVAVLDTGSAPATDLTPRTVPGIDMISDPDIAGDGDGVDNDPTDVGDSNGFFQPSSFHGAHVAGTIGAATNNQFGVSGVTWEGQIMHVRVLGIGGGTTFDILNGVLYAAGLDNSSGQVASPQADIQNLSLGGPGFSQAFQDAIDDAWGVGSLVIAAAGNENSSEPSYPAAYDNVISVAAVDFERNRAPYSNFHPTVDIAAPGGDVSEDRNGDGYADGVLSTKPDDTVNPTDFDSFSFYQGTSMAAPHVAGVAALMLAVNPSLTAAQIENGLLSTATDLGPSGRDNRFGEGLVNAFAAVQEAAGGGTGGPVLALSSTNILVQEAVDTRSIGVSNVGGGLLEVQDPTAMTDSGGSWLSASRVPIGTPTLSDTSAIDVNVDATGLGDGIYTGTVTVGSNGGSSEIGVTLAIGQGGNEPVYEVFVLAVDFAALEAVAQDNLITAGSLAYELTGLDAGNFVVVAGTDEDDDGFICDPGEPLCGVYPSLELPAAVTVSFGTVVGGIDFPLQEATIPASNPAHQGFRLLSRSSRRAAAESAPE